MTASELGAFLKARRGHVQPAALSLPTSTGRRVPGLRREEVAMLAGVSVDYYARLEQGRERHPSPAVLNAIAAALQCDQDNREHLYRLADLTPAPAMTPPTGIDPHLRDLLNSWPQSPAIIINRQLDIVLRNELAAALYRGFTHTDNLARMTFLDPAGRRFFTHWEQAAAACVASLRLALGHHDSAPAVQQLVGEMNAADPRFAQLWAHHHVRGKTHEAKSFHHPDVGDLTLLYTAFDVREFPGHQLIVYSAEPHTADADKLSLLGSLSASLNQSEA